jgi:beta-1,2-mannosidase
MTYTSYGGKTARLMVASSPDLQKWTKHGPVFAKAYGGKYLNQWSKSGSIISRYAQGKIIATKIWDKYWMYWGDQNIWAATSTDLIHWEPFEMKVNESAPIALKGQVLIDKNNPLHVLNRLNHYFIKPEKPYELVGEVNNVCFLDGLGQFKNQWFLYYGTADSKIAVAVRKAVYP